MIKHPKQHKRTQDMPKWVWECVETAWTWVCDKYGYDTSGQHLTPFRWSYNARFCKFSWGNPRYFDGNVHIRVRKPSCWVTYRKKTIGYSEEHIRAGKIETTTLALVHELTHYIQHLEKRKYSEVETTQNEIAFAKENYYHLYKQLTTIKD